MKDLVDSSVQQGLRRIWVRYQNFKFVAIVSALAIVLTSPLLRVLPALFGVVFLTAVLGTYAIWLRYHQTPCPKCGQRFASAFRSIIVGWLRPGRCSHCGLSARSYVDAGPDRD